MKKTIRRTSRIRPVRVTEMRVPPVEITQRRFSKAQAEEYAQNLDLNKLGIPVLNHRDGIFWVLDGQHRVAAVKMYFAPNDPGSIDCEVYEDLTDAEMADIFLGRDNRRAISRYEKFKVACTAEYARECDIRRTVEAQGLRVARTKDDGSVGAVGALTRVYDRSGSVALGQTLRVIRDAYAASAEAFDAGVIEAIGLVFHRYNGRVNAQQLVEQLAADRHGVRGVLRRAESVRERTGNLKVPCIASIVVDSYNKGKAKLPKWWKAEE